MTFEYMLNERERKGLELGREQGLKQGRAEGEASGLAKGASQKQREIAIHTAFLFFVCLIAAGWFL